MWLGQRSLYCEYATGFEYREGLRYFFSSPKCPDRFFLGGGGGPPRFFGGVKRQRYKTDLSPLSCAEVKNEWRYTSTPITCLRGMDRYNFTYIDVLGFFIFRASTVTLLSFSLKPLLSALR